MLTQENAKALAEFLAQDEERAKKLIEMPAEDAAKAISAEGIELTADDLAEFAKAVEAAKQQGGELDETSLEGVSGGVRIPYMGIAPILLLPVWTWIRKR